MEEDIQELARKAAEDFYNNMSPEQRSEFIQKIDSAKQGIIDDMAKVVTDTTIEIGELSTKSNDLWEKEKNLSYGQEKNDVQIERAVVTETLKVKRRFLLQKQNELQAYQNNGTSITLTDEYGEVHAGIPDFRQVTTDNITWEENTILVEPRPVYIPLIDDEVFKQMGYVMDAIRITNNTYLLSVQRVYDKSDDTRIKYNLNLQKPGVKERIPILEDQPYILVTLDQLVLIYDYYFVKAKALNQQEAERKNQRQIDHWHSLDLKKKLYYYDQRNFYNSVPEKVKKKVSKEEWDTLRLDEKEKLYIPVKRYGTPRLTSKLSDTTMWVSFHSMYQRFVDKEAYLMDKNGVQDKTGKNSSARYADPNAFEYWRKFREMMDFKIKDIRMQREDLSEIYSKAMETSFGESNTDTILKDKYGILVKRQNGSKINPPEIEDIETGWKLVNKVFGNLKPHALKDNLKISHSASTYMFAAKAIGMYVPQFATIGLSKKYGDNQFNSTFAHEVGHWIDNFVGRIKGQRWATDDYESTAGILAFTFRNNMNKPKAQQTDYVNATKECFARALQQYFGAELYGDEAVISHSYTELNKVEKLIFADKFVGKDAYESKIKPLIEKFLEENRDIIASGVDFDHTSIVDTTPETIEIETPVVDINPPKLITIPIVEDIEAYITNDYVSPYPETTRHRKPESSAIEQPKEEESISELIEGLQILADSLEGKEKAEIEELIEGLSLLI